MKRIFIIGMLLAGLMISCNKDESSKNDDSILKVTENDDGKGRCLELIFPLTKIMPDGTEITGNNREELQTAVKSWYEAHPDYNERPTWKYPIDATFKDEPVTITSDRQMKRYKEACNKKRCFHLIYPITYIMPDGTEITITGKDDMEGKMAIRAWYVEHPDVEEKPALKYPVKVKLREDGTIKRIMNENQMIRLKKSCK